MIKKYSQSIILLFAAGLMISLVSCNPARKYEKAESETINSYLSAHSDQNFTHEPSGLYYLDEVVGTGVTPQTHDTAFFHLTGKFLNGNLFDENDYNFPVSEGYLISGIEEGITYMKVGGKALMLIPSKLAYGTQGYSIIAGYTPLLFELELVKVKPGPAK